MVHPLIELEGLIGTTRGTEGGGGRRRKEEE